MRDPFLPLRGPSSLLLLLGCLMVYSVYVGRVTTIHAIYATSIVVGDQLEEEAKTDTTPGRNEYPQPSKIIREDRIEEESIRMPATLLPSEIITAKALSEIRATASNITKYTTETRIPEAHNELEPSPSKLCTSPTNNTIVASTDQDNTIDEEEWKKLKIGVFMTTHGSLKHLKFLNRCWPFATKHLPLLRDAHLIYYTSGEPPQNALAALNFKSITIRRYAELSNNATGVETEEDIKQLGAKRAMLDPFEKENQWFDGYDWIVRMNPDVLIRQDTWIRQTMLNQTVDGIFIDYTRGRRGSIKGLHSDFFAFRPEAANVTALRANFLQKPTAETHLYTGFEESIQQDRIAWLPGARRRGEFARVIGSESPVIHFHPLFNKCPNYLNARYKEFY